MNRIKTTVFLILIAVLLYSGGLAMGKKADLVITNARLIDGNGRPPIENAVIVISEGKFTTVGANAEVDIPEGTKIIDVKGKTVVPGLIDAHVHIAYPPNQMEYMMLNDAICAYRSAHFLHRHLMGGITTVRDVAARTNVSIMAKKAFQEGLFIGSRPIVVGQGIVGTAGHGSGTWQFTVEVTGPDEFRRAVRTQIGAGADLIKLLPGYSFEEAKAAIEETHSSGKKIAVHSGHLTQEPIRWAVELGADCIEHSFYIPDDTIRMMAEKDIYNVPTLAILAKLLKTPAVSKQLAMLDGFEEPEITFRKMKKAGVKMAVGTDAIFQYLKEYPGMYFEEIELFVKNGCTPMEAIVSATKIGAEVCDAADRLGTIEKDKIADLLVIEEDPLLDIKNLRKVEMIVQNGKIVKQ